MTHERPELLVVGNLAKDIVFGEEVYGGCAATIAIVGMRLGLKTGVMSVVGKDGFSSKYINYLSEMGVNTELIEQSIDSIPTCEVVSSENKIASSIWTDNGCHEAMDKMDIPEGGKKYNLVHLVSCPSNLAEKWATNINSISYEPGPLIIFDESYFDYKVAENSKFLFLNQEEHQAVIKLKRGVYEDGYDFANLSAMIVTLGSEGSLIFNNRGECIKIEASPLESNVIDSVGAGDNFKAGFLYGYLSGLSLDISAKIGSDLGALCVQQKGAILPEYQVKLIRDKYNSTIF